MKMIKKLYTNEEVLSKLEEIWEKYDVLGKKGYDQGSVTGSRFSRETGEKEECGRCFLGWLLFDAFDGNQEAFYNFYGKTMFRGLVTAVIEEGYGCKGDDFFNNWYNVFNETRPLNALGEARSFLSEKDAERVKKLTGLFPNS